MAEKNVFIENFERAMKKCDVHISESIKDVIIAVAEYAKEKMDGYDVLNYFFADHGWNHSCRLSQYALILIGNLGEECKKQFETSMWSDMIVLLWTAIALHDIGMNYIESEEELAQLIKKPIGRKDHVRKSGEFISELIDRINEAGVMDKDGRFFSTWEHYWNDTGTVDSITALRIVQDIVLMHGEEENWLQQDKIGALERDILVDINFSRQDSYKKIISYCEAILCLSDLLDICSDRMNIFSNKDLNKIFQKMENISEKRITFEHWVSHMITRVNYDDFEKDGYIKLNVYMYSKDSKIYLMEPLRIIYPSLGAIKACIQWGNHENLISILEEDFGYKGIKLDFVAQNARTWNGINDIAKELIIYDKELIYDINEKVKGLSNIFMIELFSRWIKENWCVEKDIVFYPAIRSVFHLIQEGASLHLTYERKTRNIIKNLTAFIVDFEDKEHMIYNINDYFLTALNVFFEVLNKRKNIQNISIITKGDTVFSSLYNGTNRDRNIAYIIIVRNGFEDDLSRLINEINSKNDESFGVLIFAEGKADFCEKENCQIIRFATNKDKLASVKEELNKYAIRRWGDKETLSSKEREQAQQLLIEETIGIGVFFKELKIIYNGIQANKERIITELEKDQYSSLFILNLFEMLSINLDGKRQINSDELERFYGKFSEQNRIYNMESFEEAVQTLFCLCEERDGIIQLLEKYRDSFENLIIDSSREVNLDIKKNLFQMMIFFWLYNYRKVNFKSVCYREYLTYLSPKQLCSYILNENINLEERINISFETSEIIADKLRKDFKEEAIKVFIVEFIEGLLVDRNLLIENEDFICFQSIYRIFRGVLIPDMEDLILFLIDEIEKMDSDIGYLGFIEGVCSAKLGENNKLKDIVDDVMGGFIEKIFHDSDKSIKYMAYDILYHYEKDELKKKYYNSSWENICAFLHGIEDIREKNRTSVYYDWKEMRKRFMFIISETSPSIRGRNMFDKKERSK